MQRAAGIKARGWHVLFPRPLSGAGCRRSIGKFLDARPAAAKHSARRGNTTRSFRLLRRVASLSAGVHFSSASCSFPLLLDVAYRGRCPFPHRAVCACALLSAGGAYPRVPLRALISAVLGRTPRVVKKLPFARACRFRSFSLHRIPRLMATCAPKRKRMMSGNFRVTLY